jgi:hypothetical protein
MRQADLQSSEPRAVEALLAVALQLRARLTMADGSKRDLGAEAVFQRSFGFKNPEIATIIGSTPGSVAELISRAQKSAKGAKRGHAKDK